MSVIDEKLQRFENIIFSDVDSKVNATIEEAATARCLSEHHEQIMDKYFDYMQDQVHLIQSDIKRQMAKAYQAQNELLLYRATKFQKKCFKMSKNN